MQFDFFSLTPSSKFQLFSLPLSLSLIKLSLSREMAVAMAAWNLALYFSASDNSFRALDKSKTICNASLLKLKASSGFAAADPCSVLHKRRFSSSGTTIIPQAMPVTDVEDGNQGKTDTVPTPKVIIDQDSDPDATVVEITFGDWLGALLDTMNALKNLGLDVVKANAFLDFSGKHNKFFITKGDTGRKVEEPELLEAIRLTIINNLIQYHPGLLAKAKFHVSYKGKAIIKPLQQVLANSLRYFLRRPTTEEASF